MRLSKYLYITALISLMMGSVQKACAERKFVHPGITYTQADIDRMKAMIAAKEEPFYSTFMMLKTSSYSSPSGSVSDRGSSIGEGKFNGTIGADGRRAHDLALVYVLTGEKKYADKAVKYLNANSHYTNTSARGTGPLDNGKINLLIEAAELLRDYEGWLPADQQRFKDMLVYPGFSQTEDFYKKYASTDDSKNGITFYWNCYNFDAGRFGNQGLFAARALLAMGVYLDNDVIFDRVYQYLNGTQDRHFANYPDLPYVAGPRTPKSSFSEVTQSSATASGFNTSTSIPNYGYDEQLQYYFYKNGQCQEASRDQGHNMCGVSMYISIAEMLWNQGIDMYGALDNRILTATEYNTRINVTCISDYDKYMTDRDWTQPWHPTYYSVTGTVPTADWKPATSYSASDNREPSDPESFYQTWSRSARWFSKDIATDGGDKLGSSGSREAAYAHYHIRMGMPDEEMTWLGRYRQYMLNKYSYENWGMDAGHQYEWCGWGTLTKTRLPWMPGDPVTFVDGNRKFGIHKPDEDVLCADFDYIAADGNGRTYYKNEYASKSNSHRPEDAVAIEEGDGACVVTDMTDGEWLTYTYALTAGDYTLQLRYASDKAQKIVVYIDEEKKGEMEIAATGDAFANTSLQMAGLTAGAHVLKIEVQGQGAKVKLSKINLATGLTGFDKLVASDMTGKESHVFDLTGKRASQVNGGLYLVDGHKRVIR